MAHKRLAPKLSLDFHQTFTTLSKKSALSSLLPTRFQGTFQPTPQATSQATSQTPLSRGSWTN
ncbi:MAG: hypothetical protein LBF22_08130 [Deltaproteobacteria bacterium]|nr:hypothetical protein [Deltaproteobacteria bacterium]